MIAIPTRYLACSVRLYLAHAEAVFPKLSTQTLSHADWHETHAGASMLNEERNGRQLSLYICSWFMCEGQALVA